MSSKELGDWNRRERSEHEHEHGREISESANEWGFMILRDWRNREVGAAGIRGGGMLGSGDQQTPPQSH